jgi:hypothetical protein
MSLFLPLASFILLFFCGRFLGKEILPPTFICFSESPVALPVTLPITQAAQFLQFILNYMAQSYIPLVLIFVTAVPTVLVLLYIMLRVSTNYVFFSWTMFVTFFLTYIIYILPAVMLLITLPFTAFTGFLFLRYFTVGTPVTQDKLLPFQRKLILLLRKYGIIPYFYKIIFFLFIYPSEQWYKRITAVQQFSTVVYVFIVRIYVFSYVFLQYIYSQYLLTCIFLIIYFTLLGHLLKLLRTISLVAVGWSNLLMIEEGQDPSNPSNHHSSNEGSGSGSSSGSGSTRPYFALFSFNKHRSYNYYSYSAPHRLTFNQKLGLTGGLCTFAITCAGTALAYQNLALTKEAVLQSQRQTAELSKQTAELSKQTAELSRQNDLAELQNGIISEDEYRERRRGK